jgi:DNA-binding response OmpR family regulator
MSIRPGILVANPDRGIQRLLRRTFGSAGYQVAVADSGAAALRLAELGESDLIVLSVDFTDVAGSDLIEHVRQVSKAPIIALFAANGPWSARTVLDIGADDCLEEPFMVKELAARARRLLLRAGVWLHPHAIPTGAGLIEIDPLARTVRLGGRWLHLTGREFDLLLVLLSADGAAVPFDDVVNRIWGSGYRNARQNLRRVVSSLRARIEADPVRPALLISLRGVGYRLVVSAAESSAPGLTE